MGSKLRPCAVAPVASRAAVLATSCGCRQRACARCPASAQTNDPLDDWGVVPRPRATDTRCCVGSTRRLWESALSERSLDISARRPIQGCCTRRLANTWVTAERLRTEALAGKRLRPPPQTTRPSCIGHTGGRCVCRSLQQDKLQLCGHNPRHAAARCVAQTQQTNRPHPLDNTWQAGARCVANASVAAAADAPADSRRKRWQCLHAL